MTTTKTVRLCTGKLANMRQSIKISEIKVNPRMRRQVDNLDGLADSIRRNGLIQPIVLTPDKTLVAGERRLRAHQRLGLETIDYVLKDEVPESVRMEMEFEENYWREDMPWQDEAIGILRIYRQKKREGALGGFSEHWTRIVADMFGLAVGTINYILKVAQRLEQELLLPEAKRRLWGFSNASEAYRLGLLAEEEDQINTQLAQMHKQQVNSQQQERAMRELSKFVETVESSPDLLAAERQRYESNPQNKMPFDQYWAEKKALDSEQKRTIYLSNRIIQGDCIEFMLRPENASRFDHIITDPPYAIDMEMLNQQNQSGGLRDLDRVIDAHQVDENTALLAKFFPAAFQCTKAHSFVIVCGDAMMWQYMYDHAIKAGFAVQRWPFIWRKVNQAVMNNCSGYNTTKDFEIAMICRKPGATLAKKWNTSIQDGSNVQAVKDTGHPFAKPYELTKAFVEMVSLENQLILEPFAGGGSMVLEILRQKRQVVAVEKETHHYNGLLETVKQFYLKLNKDFVFK